MWNSVTICASCFGIAIVNNLQQSLPIFIAAFTLLCLGYILGKTITNG